MDLISVIVPAYNYAHFIEETLQSVARQTYQTLECIVIDDGSVDETREVVEAFCRKDSRFRYYYQNNQGLAAARNAGLTRSAGSFISFLDADDLWEDTKLSNQIKVFEEQRCDVVFSGCCSFLGGDEFQVMKRSSIQTFSVYDFLNVDIVTGSSSSVIIKRGVYEKVGLFDIGLRSLEDFDYWFRCSLHGFIFKACESIDVKIRIHKTSMSTNHLKMYQFHFIVLERQIAMLKSANLFKGGAVLLKPLTGRLRRIRWYANELKRYDLCLNTHLFGFTFLGMSYFNILNISNFCRDSFYCLLRRRVQN